MIVPDVVVRNRRAIGLILLTVFLPGAVQYIAGDRRVGRTALRIRGMLVVFTLLIGLGLYSWRGPTVGFLLNGMATVVMRIPVWLVSLSWLALLFDVWRLSRPPDLKCRAHLALTGTRLAPVAVVDLGTNLLASTFTAAGYISDVFTGGGGGQAKRSYCNILLLGVDATVDREGIRPDPINVASIDAETGRTAVFGLPRSLVGAPFPFLPLLAKLHPDGFRYDEECMLNGIYTLGQGHADLYPGKEAGLTVMKEAVSGTLGPELNYYTMVDPARFQRLVDAMGGINLDIGKRVPIGGIRLEIHGWIEPGINVRLDNYHALWFARSRADSDDCERMAQQKCMMTTMAKRLGPDTVATKFVDLAEAGSDVARINAGANQLSELMELAIKGKAPLIEPVNFVPPLVHTPSPDFTLTHRVMTETIDASEANGTSAAPMSSSVPTPTSTSPAPTEKITSQNSKAKASSRTVGGANPPPNTMLSANTPVYRVS